MYGLNVVVPGQVQRIASDLHPRLTAFDHIRQRHTLVVKRFEAQDLDHLRERLRVAIQGTTPITARITGIGYFAEPAAGSAPVVYLSVDSPGLRDLHLRLCETFGTVSGLEGKDYTPHVTLARDGDVEDAKALASVEVEPIEWTVSELRIWSKEYREFVHRLRLPA